MARELRLNEDVIASFNKLSPGLLIAAALAIVLVIANVGWTLELCDRDSGEVHSAQALLVSTSSGFSPVLQNVCPPSTKIHCAGSHNESGSAFGLSPAPRVADSLDHFVVPEFLSGLIANPKVPLSSDFATNHTATFHSTILRLSFLSVFRI